MDKLPKEVLEAKEKGMSVLQLTNEEDETVYYFRKPAKVDMNKYMTYVAKKKVATGTQNLVLDLAILPTRKELQTLFDELPGMMVSISNSLQEAVGLNEDFNVKKL